MKVRVLGCGGSFGSPLAWNRNGNIDINNPKNHRTRSSVLININDQDLLIDTSPDLRAQLYNAQCTKIDAVLFTHEHSDHTAGLPDMRAMSLINQSIIPAYLSSDIKESMTRNYKYIFDGHKDYSPFMSVKTILVEPDIILRQKSQPVNIVGPDEKKLIFNLLIDHGEKQACP